MPVVFVKGKTILIKFLLFIELINNLLNPNSDVATTISKSPSLSISFTTEPTDSSFSFTSNESQSIINFSPS